MGTSTYDDIASLRNFHRRDVERIDHLGLRFGGVGPNAPRVSIDFSRTGQGASLEVHGDDERKVKTALDVLTAELDEHAQFPKRGGAGWALFGGVAWFVALLSIVYLILRAQTSPSGQIPILAVVTSAVVIIVLIAGYIVGPWLLTRFEVLATGQETRLQRFYGWVFVPLLVPVGLWVLSLVWHP
jgi:hypothetical protein